jgi:ssDNA-binding Zn-finger/Zn-ribbon topoisomerase 1
MSNCLNCTKWDKNISEMNSMFVMAAIHGAVISVEEFSYCPWCGKQLIKKKTRKGTKE